MASHGAFGGVASIELVAENNGVMVLSTKEALSFKDVQAIIVGCKAQHRMLNIIADGGWDADIDSFLGNEKSIVKHMALFGVGKSSISGCTQYPSLCRATYASVTTACQGDMVLLLPSSPKNHLFGSNEECSEAFTRLVGYFASCIGREPSTLVLHEAGNDSTIRSSQRS